MSDPPSPDGGVFDPTRIKRPDAALLTYYIIVSALTLIGFPFVFLPLYFKYHTLRYAFDDKGVSMSWGILFKREIYLTYRRIQDIHVSRNLIERWLGLASVAIQTASGSSGAEMTVVGLRNPEDLRDYLYARMRGAHHDGGEGEGGPDAVAPADEALALLREIRDELRRLGDARRRGRGLVMTEPASSATDRAARWMYRGIWHGLVEWFRVPDQPPTLPDEAGAAADAFQPHGGFLRYLKLWFWIVAILIDLAILVGWIVITVVEPWVGLVLLVPALVLAFLPDVIAFIAIHLRYDTTWYLMSDRSLRVRRGVWLIHEMTVTYENIQNVKVQQGPVQRLFGISDVIVETAGGGGESGSSGFAIANRAVIEGVANATALRDRILRRLRESGSAGLGDEGDEDRGSAGGAWTSEHLAVLREIRGAVERLAG